MLDYILSFYKLILIQPFNDLIQPDFIDLGMYPDVKHKITILVTGSMSSGTVSKRVMGNGSSTHDFADDLFLSFPQRRH